MSKRPIAPPPGDKPVRTAPPPPPAWRHWLWPIAILATVLLYIVLPALHVSSTRALSYSQFITEAGNHTIKTVTFESGTNGSNTLATGELTADVVKSVTASPPSSGLGSIVLSLLIFLLPLMLLFYLFRRMSRGAGSTMQGVLGVGRSRAKVFDAERPQTKFTDVAGYDGAKAEIVEVVDFLRNSDRYRRAGAMAPRGVLMVGPPGTGKTLLARAVAGEASVPFFSVTGSSFVEMFVGVGAARVRDLFAEARKRAPAIIFVDEIDA